MFESNLANLTAQYQQTYLVYCYKIMQYLQACAWLAEQQKTQKQAEIKQVKQKTASGVKKLGQEPNQQSHDFKSLIHQEKIKPNKKVASESSQGTFRGNGLGILANPSNNSNWKPPSVGDTIAGTLSGMFSNMGNDLLNTGKTALYGAGLVADGFNNAVTYPFLDGAATVGDYMLPLEPAFLYLDQHPIGREIHGALFYLGAGLRSLRVLRGLDKAEDVVKLVNGRMPINSRFANSVYPASKLPISIAAKYPKGVPFNRKGFPNFSAYSISNQTISLGKSRAVDFARADKAAGYSRANPRPAGYTWHHHENPGTMQLVPTDLHDAVKHTGGIATSR